MSTQLAFHNTKFNVVTHNNQIWLSSKELAQALEYATDNAVTMLYNKNSDEFTDVMTQVVESTTSGNYRKKVRIFSLRGAHLIAMFARTPVAKEFRRWVLDILDKEVGESVTTPVTQSYSVRRSEVTAFRYLVKLTYKDTLTGQVETFTGGANSPDEIIQGTAKRFGMYITEMIVMPVNAYC
ncbi:TPA: Bro-N domain-containing protein [Salmonella enterica subsp. enterica serovar Mississippi]